MRKGILAAIACPFLALSPGPAYSSDSGAQPEHQEGTEDAAASAGVMIDLRVPLGSPFFADTPLAVVNDEPITFSDVSRSIFSMHAGKAEGPTAVRKDFAKLLQRIVTTKLIVLEARNIGLHELPDLESQIEAFSGDLLVSILMTEAVDAVEPDPADVDELYRRLSREFLLTSLTFATEEEALSFVQEYRSGAQLDELAGRFIEEGRADGDLAAREYIKLKDLLPKVARELLDMEVGSLSQVFTSPGGFLLFHVEDIRFYEDPSVEAEARKRVLDPLKRKKGKEYGDLLEAKYAVINEDVLEDADFESQRRGFLGFGEPQAVDYQALRQDGRVVATVRGDDAFAVTVGDLARRVESTYFHGIDKALEKGQKLNETKRLVLKNMLFKKTARMEAISQGIDQRAEYLEALEGRTNALLFDTFVHKVLRPDVEITEEDLREYYEAHLSELSTPKMLRLNGLAFDDLRDAEGALQKLRSGADFRWVSANSPGQVDRDAEEKSAFDNTLLSLTALPEDLHEAAEDAAQGDVLLYSGVDNHHYAIFVEQVFPATPEAYEKVRERIANDVLQSKVQALIAYWSGELQEAYDTEIFVTGLSQLREGEPSP